MDSHLVYSIIIYYIIINILKVLGKSLHFLIFIKVFRIFSKLNMSICYSHRQTVTSSLPLLFGSMLILLAHTQQHSRLSQDSESGTAQLNPVFTAVVNESLAEVIFILFTKPKQRKNNPLPTPTTSSVPGGLQPRQQNKEEYFKKTLC